MKRERNKKALQRKKGKRKKDCGDRAPPLKRKKKIEKENKARNETRTSTHATPNATMELEGEGGGERMGKEELKK
ncbi:hypothetical protein Tco_0795859 [Tanacetum coccineum]